jgi:Protein of unknown function (DUF3800)
LGDLSLRIFIDEGGTFVPETGWSVVCALALPHKEVGLARREIGRATRIWPRHKGELKGGGLGADQLTALTDTLYRNDALLRACAIDVSREDPAGVDRHKSEQCDKITKHLTVEHHPRLVDQVWDLRRALERMPQQLYLQSVLLSELVWATCENVAMYFAQRRPRELAAFEWTIDAKDPLRITTYEKWWQDVLAPLLQSKSRRKPMICVDDPHFNYEFFNRSYEMKEEVWYPDESPKMVDGYNIRKMVTEHLAFVDSRDEVLIQAVDILASFLRRLLEGEFENDAAVAVARALGRLQIKWTPRQQTQSLQLLTLSSLPAPQDNIANILQHMTMGGRDMFKPTPRRRTQRRNPQVTA